MYLIAKYLLVNSDSFHVNFKHTNFNDLILIIGRYFNIFIKTYIKSLKIWTK